MNNKDWWKRNWGSALAVLSGVVSITGASFVLGPLFLLMLVVFYATLSSVRELRKNWHDV